MKQRPGEYCCASCQGQLSPATDQGLQAIRHLMCLHHRQGARWQRQMGDPVFLQQPAQRRPGNQLLARSQMQAVRNPGRLP